MQPRRAGGPPSSDDLVYDVPSTYLGVDPPADISFDAVPDVPFDVVPDTSSSPAKRGKNRARPLLETSEVAPQRQLPPPEVTQALSVCLACGASPPVGGDCKHEEVAHLHAAGSAVITAARKLAAAVAERHAQERALRRLVGLEVAMGRGDLDAPTPSLAARPLSAGDTGPCARCGHTPHTSERPTRRGGKRNTAETQGTFAFAAPPKERGET